MDSWEFSLWLAAYRRNPWGPERADLNAGTIAATVANMAGRVLKQGHRSTPADFFPVFKDADETRPAEVDPVDFIMGAGRAVTHD